MNDSKNNTLADFEPWNKEPHLKNSIASNGGYHSGVL